MMRKSPWRWLFRLVFAVIFVILAGLLAASANGIMFNPKTRTFEQTGIIALVASDPPYRLMVNGQPRAMNRSEVRLGNLFAGFYSIELAKDGFLPWSRVDRLDPGEVIVHSGIRLFRAHPEIVDATAAQSRALTEPLEISDDLDVRGSEIWVKPIVSLYPIRQIGDAFVLVARYSYPPHGVQWLPGKDQIMFQIENEIRVIDRVGGNDVVLAELSTGDAADFRVTDGGRNLVYRDGERVLVRPL